MEEAFLSTSTTSRANSTTPDSYKKLAEKLKAIPEAAKIGENYLFLSGDLAGIFRPCGAEPQGRRAGQQA